MVLTQCESCPVRSSLVLTQCEFCPELVWSFCGRVDSRLVTIDERFCVTVQAISPIQEIGISHVGWAVFVFEPDRRQAIVVQVSVRTGSGAWKLLVDPLGVHRSVPGSAGFDPRRKQWTVLLRQVPRRVLVAPVRMLHDDTGSGENGQRPILHSSRPRELRRRPMVVLSSVYWMDPLSWLSRAFTSRSCMS